MIGWLRLSDADLYAGCKPLTVRVRMEGTEQRPKWYAYVCHEVSAARVKQGAAEGAIGVDRNVGQATDSEDTVYRMTDTSHLDANIKRKQRKFNRQQKGSNRRRRTGGQLRKLHRKRRRTRDNDTHQANRKMADTAHTVVVEDLNTKGMTRSAKGTVESPGTNVKAKAGLNRAILASGWGGLERKLAYKAGALLRVDAAYTSQTCAVCGHVHKDNRPSQAVFACGACGHRTHADHNAAVNILARAGLPPRARSARGNGAATRRGAIPSGTPTTREPGGGGPQGP
jgi:transposase